MRPAKRVASSLGADKGRTPRLRVKVKGSRVVLVGIRGGVPAIVGGDRRRRRRSRRRGGRVFVVASLITHFFSARIAIRWQPKNVVSSPRDFFFEAAMALSLETSHGPISVKLYHQETPKTSRNFLELCKSGYYDGVSIHVRLGACEAARERHDERMLFLVSAPPLPRVRSSLTRPAPAGAWLRGGELVPPTIAMAGRNSLSSPTLRSSLSLLVLVLRVRGAGRCTRDGPGGLPRITPPMVWGLPSLLFCTAPTGPATDPGPFRLIV